MRSIAGWSGATTPRARSPASPPPVVAGNTAVSPSGKPTDFAPDTAMLTETYAAAARLSPVPQSTDDGHVFHGLFRSNGGEPVAPVVSSLWSSPPSSGQDAPESTCPGGQARRRPQPAPIPAARGASRWAAAR